METKLFDTSHLFLVRIQCHDESTLVKGGACQAVIGVKDTRERMVIAANFTIK